MDKQLSDIQRSLLETHNAVLTHNIAVKRILEGISHAPRYLPSAQSNIAKEHLTQSLVDEDKVEIEASSTVSTIPPEYIEKRDTDYDRESMPLYCWALLTHSRGLRGITQPASSFELSQSFFPETYSASQRLPQSSLMVIEACELDSSSDYKTNLYNVLYLSSPRRWCRISVSIRMHRSSQYWALTRVAKDERTPGEDANISPATLPYSLLMNVQQKLQVRRKAVLHLHVTGEEDLQEEHDLLDSNLVPTRSTVDSAHLEALGYLDDLGCSRYLNPT